MNKFMGGLILGVIVTCFFFIMYHPFEKKRSNPDTPIVESPVDSLQVAANILEHDTGTGRGRAYTQNKDKINRDSLVLFAKSLIGTPYLYGNANPLKGFDCSGFITFVFNHFKFAVPRSSYEFEHIGTKRTFGTCKPGDVILFTGTDPLERTIGHIGIVTDVANGNLSFIHSSSGKANGVTITSMDDKFYQERFIGVIDLVSQN